MIFMVMVGLLLLLLMMLLSSCGFLFSHARYDNYASDNHWPTNESNPNGCSFFSRGGGCSPGTYLNGSETADCPPGYFCPPSTRCLIQCTAGVSLVLIRM